MNAVEEIVWEGKFNDEYSKEYHCRIVVASEEHYATIVSVQRKIKPEDENYLTVSQDSYVWHKAIATALSLPKTGPLFHY